MGAWSARLIVAGTSLGRLVDDACGVVRMMRLWVEVARSIGATSPRGSDEQTRRAFEREARDCLIGTGGGQMDHRLGFLCCHACGEF